VGKALFRALLILLLVAVVVTGITVYALTRRGLSTRVEPTRVEEIVARGVRRLATPSAVRTQSNPVAKTPDVLDEAMGHFADHCATCHANDGSGNTSIGRGLWPKAPDMRLAVTQELSDGELFWIIENGIRFTGMPAWGDGTKEGQEASWRLVHFIRRLPRLTPAEIDEMEALNPQPPDEIRQQIEEEEFLKGTEKTPAEPAAPHKHPGGTR